MKVITSLENRNVLLKGTTENVFSAEWILINNFLGPLMKVGLPLIKMCSQHYLKVFWCH